MRFIGWFTALAVLLVAVVAGTIGYNLGLSANIATSGVTPAVYPVYGWGWGFGFGHIFGLFFFLIIIFVIFGALRRAAWGGHHGRGPWMGRGYGPGGYGPGGSWKQAADDEFSRWHRRAHGETEDKADSSGPIAQS